MKLTIVLGCSLLAAIASAQDYGKVMEQKLKTLLGAPSTKGYSFASYPVDNFGLYTSTNSQTQTELCATWTCIAEDNDVPADADANAQMQLITKSNKRFAEKGTGGPIMFTGEEKRNIGLTVMLPQLLKVIGITFDASTAKDVTFDFDLGPVTIRKIIPDRYIQRINALPNTSSVKTAFNSKKLLVVYQDIVSSTMKVTIKFDAKNKVDFDAKLSAALAGKVGQIIGGKDTELKLHVDAAKKGDYALTIAHPVILATLTKKQPDQRTLGGPDWSNWPTVKSARSTIFK